MDWQRKCLQVSSFLHKSVKNIDTPNHLQETINNGDTSPTADLPAIALNPQKRAAIDSKK